MPNKLDEHVHVGEYEGDWAHWFADERKRLPAALGLASEDLQHIGSTAVAGMIAKPIVDIMIGFVGCHYESFGEAGVPGRLYLRRRGLQSINRHLVCKGGNHWTNNIAMRDYLRSSAQARARYGRAKTAALAGEATALLAYSEAKAELVRTLLDEALAQQRGQPTGSSC